MDEQILRKIVEEVVSNALEPIKKDLSDVKNIQSEMKDTLESRVLPSVTNTELTLQSYADSYKINQHNIERADTRLTTVEDKLEIIPPEELKIPHFVPK